MDLLTQKGPLSLVNLTQPWNSKFQNFSTFYDSFSNCMVLMKEGFFVIWDIYDKQHNLGENSITLNLATNYEQVYACAVHPEKNCLSLQISDNSIVLLFLREDSAEEVKLTFQKAKIVNAITFMLGEDFNFMVASNVSIDLYKVNMHQMSAKLIKNISITMNEPQFYYEPTTCVTVVCDQKGLCQPYYLNLHDQRKVKGQSFSLDLSETPVADSTSTDNKRVSGNQARSSIGERALSFFKKPQETINLKFSLANNNYNKNLKILTDKIEMIDQTIVQASENKKYGILLSTPNEKRNQHQVLLTTMYHRVLFLHFNPFTSQIQAYELDVNHTFKNAGFIQVQQGNSPMGKDLVQMQVIDNLLVVHNMDQRVTQLYDLKLEDWNVPLLREDIRVETSSALKGKFYTDLLLKEENKYAALLEIASKSYPSNANRELSSQRTSVESSEQRKSEQSLSSGALKNEDNSSSSQIHEDVKDPNEPVTVTENANSTQPTQDKVQVEDLKRGSLSFIESQMENVDLRDFDFYDRKNIFIDPMIVIDVKNHSCLTLKLKLERFVNTCRDPLRLMGSLLCRSRNKFIFLKQLRDIILSQKINLSQLSSLFMRINSIYKQASIERQTYIRKSQINPQAKIVSQNPLHQGYYMDLLIIQLQRMSRLRDHTSFIAKSLNEMLMEYHPTNRVLTGEVIIFQSEMLEIFKYAIAHSTHPIRGEEPQNMEEINIDKDKRLKPRFVTGMIQEFQRSLLEHQIPSQNSQQNLLVRYILETKEYSTLQNMLQYRVLNESLELARSLIDLGSSLSQPNFPPAFQIGLDMLKKLKMFDEIVEVLLKEGDILKAINFAQEIGLHSLKMSVINDKLEELRQKGKKKQADIIMKRIREIKKVTTCFYTYILQQDEVRMKAENEYKPTICDE